MSALIDQVAVNRKAVAITFDDGPHPVYTPQILEIFREAGARATFFMVGTEMVKYPDLVRLVSESGHEIGNHSYTHPNLAELEASVCRSELQKTHQLVEKETGKAPQVCRPPYLAYDRQTEEIAGELGYSLIGAANPDARDWDMPGTDHILAATRPTLKPGALFLFHDGYGDRSQTVEAVRILVAEWIAAGYELLTVSELLASV